jgi:response regulator of citrate/malate metabolism
MTTATWTMETPTTTPKRRRRKGAKRAPRGANREAIMKVLEVAGADLSVGEVSNSSGVGRVSADQILKKLALDGTVTQRKSTSGGRKRALYKLKRGAAKA